jgi:hypothetical protein
MKIGHPRPVLSADPFRRLGLALVAVALVVAVIGSLGAPLITPVATGMDVSLAAAQWTLTVTLFTGAIAGPVLGRLGSGPKCMPTPEPQHLTKHTGYCTPPE